MHTKTSIKHKVDTSEDKQPVHVMISEPTALRKLILKSAIESVRLLHNHSEIKNLLDQEKVYIKHLQGVHKELKELERVLEDNYMPKLSEEYEVKLEKEFYVSENVNKNIKEDADIEKLKKELEEIEKKLSHL